LRAPRRKPRTAKPAAKAQEPGVWLFDPERARITVRNAEAVLAQLPVFLAGWPFKWSGPSGADACEIDVREEQGALVVARTGPSGDVRSFATALDAANGLAGALVSAFTMRDEQMICLHAAAVALGGGVALFVGDSGAGKSSVSLNLAVRGHTLFGDDRIAVRLDGAGVAVCLGLMPKARLPLPASADDRFAAFIEAFSAFQTDAIAYLRPPNGVIAEFGDALPLSAIFLLERRGTGKTRVSTASRPDIVTAVVEHAFAPHIATSALIGRAAALAAAVPGFHLSFSDSRQAAETAAAAVATAAETR